MKTAFQQLFEDRERLLRWAESQAAKVYNTQARKIDFLIAPEPTRFEEVQHGVCAEADKWKEAMGDEISYMVRFGVFTKMTKAQAKGRRSTSFATFGMPLGIQTEDGIRWSDYSI